MKNIKRTLLAILGVIFLFSTLYVIPCIAQTTREKSDDRPERFLTMAAEYPGIEVVSGEDVDLNIVLHNRGKNDEKVSLNITNIPEGWKARIKTFKFGVTSVHVPAGEDKTLTFEAGPDEGIKPGRYRFRIDGETHDGRIKLTEYISVRVIKKKEEVEKERGIKLTTSYPVLRGPVKGKFEFTLDVENQLDEDANFELFASAPEGWNVNFKPAYETKYISSLILRAKQSRNIAVEVSPLSTTLPGEYPVNIKVTSNGAKGETQLKVILTGTHELKVGTISGLLSLEARQGKPSNVSLYVRNTGTATNNDISFMSIKPENWKVELKPETIETLKPGELEQVEVIITPYEEALVGDYSIDISAKGEEANDSAEFRVTVKATALWGWVGIAIIVVVVGGLTSLFRFLGRR